MKINWGMIVFIVVVLAFLGVIIMVGLQQDEFKKQRIVFCEDNEGIYVGGVWKVYCDIKENGIYQRHIIEGQGEEMYLIIG